MGKRRRAPRPDARAYFDDTGGHSPYTIEGRLTQLGSFFSGARRRGGWAEHAARGLAVLLLLPLVIALVAAMVSLLRGT